MLTADDIHARVRERPFVPLRIVTSSGQSFDIRHPDLIMIGRRFLILGTASSENPAHCEQANRIAIMHITALEDLPPSSPPGGDGQQQ